VRKQLGVSRGPPRPKINRYFSIRTNGLPMASVLSLFRKTGRKFYGPIKWGEINWGERELPSKPGVYVVVVKQLGSDVYPGRLPRDVRCRRVYGHRIVYVGKAKDLKKRLRQFYRHKYGNRGPHSGGQDVLRLAPKNRPASELRIYWAVARNFSAAESELIGVFISKTGQLPFANHREPKRPSERKQ
jgi:hypothetical protein